MKLWVRLLIFLLITIWNMLNWFSYFEQFAGWLFYAFPFLHQTFSLVCHLDDQKLITINNVTSFLCSRCTGIYLGAWLTSLLALFNIIKYNKIVTLKFLFSALLLVFLDVLLITINLYSYSKLIAFTTGLILGFIIMLYLYKAFENLITELKTR